MGGYNVSLTYFKQNGKYYTEGEYTTYKESMYKIVDEVKIMKATENLPGIYGSEWIIHIEPEDSHPMGYPHLII